MENHEPTLVEGDETKALSVWAQMLLGRFEHGDHVHLPAVRGLASGVQNGPASSTAL